MMFRFKLYVTPSSAHTIQTIHDLRRLLDRRLSQPYELQLIDVLEDPGLAVSEGVRLTPTLVRESPLPRRRLVGDLLERAHLLLEPDPRDPA